MNHKNEINRLFSEKTADEYQEAMNSLEIEAAHDYNATEIDDREQALKNILHTFLNEILHDAEQTHETIFELRNELKRRKALNSFYQDELSKYLANPNIPNNRL